MTELESQVAAHASLDDVAREIDHERIAALVTQRELADESGISLATYWRSMKRYSPDLHLRPDTRVRNLKAIKSALQRIAEREQA